MVKLEKIIDLAEEAEGMIDEAKAETVSQHLTMQLDMANSNLRGAVMALKEAIKTKEAFASQEMSNHVAGMMTDDPKAIDEFVNIVKTKPELYNQLKERFK